jgi:hypothetical protein
MGGSSGSVIGVAHQCSWLETCQDPGVDAAVWISVVAASVTVASLPFSVRAANSARLSVGEARRRTELQERVHRDSAQPYVWADLQGDDAQGQLLRLIVTNEGPSIATAVHVTFEPPLQTTGDSTQLDQVQERLRIGLSSLAPGRRLQWTVDMAHRVLQQGLPLVYTVSITGEGPFGPMEPLTYVVDLNDLRGAADSPSGSLHRVAERLKELTKVISDKQ